MEYLEQMKRFNLGPAGEADCPVYDGMFDYFQVCLSPTRSPRQYHAHSVSLAFCVTPVRKVLGSLYQQ